jgi:putative salt-induced outer membrane protein YdiY
VTLGRALLIGVVLGWAFAAGAASAAADEVKLRNGDLLHGVLNRGNSDGLQFKHRIGQTWKLPWKDVLALSSDGPITLRMKDGTIYKGRVQFAESDRKLTILPAKHGPIRDIDIGDIAALGEPPSPWSGTLSAGLTYQDGNTREATGIVRFSAQRKGEHDLLEARGAYTYSESIGEVTARNGSARIQYNYKVVKDGYIYVGGNFEYDRFKFLNLRSRFGGGLGYALFDRDWIEWRVEAGIDYTNEDLRNTSDERFTSGRVATTVRWKIASWARFVERVSWNPSFEWIRDFTLRSETTLSLDMAWGFALGLSITVDYDEIPPPSALHRTDAKYVALLTFTF